MQSLYINTLNNSYFFQLCFSLRTYILKSLLHCFVKNLLFPFQRSLSMWIT